MPYVQSSVRPGTAGNTRSDIEIPVDDFELARGLYFGGSLFVEVTNFGSSKSPHYPGDPVEYEIVGIEGTVWDDETEEERPVTKQDLNAVRKVVDADRTRDAESVREEVYDYIEYSREYDRDYGGPSGYRRGSANRTAMRLPKFKDEYLDLFFAEKGLRDRIYDVEAPDGTPHSIPTGVVLEHIAMTRGREKEQIKDIIRKIDFSNGDIHHFLEHLATAIAANYRGASDKSAAETFKCPKCDSKVLKQTSYCLKCKKKVKEASIHDELVKLGSVNPDLRVHIRPVLRTIEAREDLWTDRSVSPSGKRYPKSVYDKLPEAMRPFGWATPAPGLSGDHPEPWRVAKKDKAVSMMKRKGLEFKDVYAEYADVHRGKIRLFVGLRDNRDRMDHADRIESLASELRRDGLPVMMSKDGHNLYLVDDLKKEVLKSASANKKTFKCPDCESKVLEQTSYCLSCKKKVKKAGRIPHWPIASSTKEKLEAKAEATLNSIHEVIWDDYLTWGESAFASMVEDTGDENTAMVAMYAIETALTKRLDEMKRDVKDLLSQVKTHGRSMGHEAAHIVVTTDDYEGLEEAVERLAARARLAVDVRNDGRGRYRVHLEGDNAYDKAAKMVGQLARQFPNLSKAFRGS